MDDIRPGAKEELVAWLDRHRACPEGRAWALDNCSSLPELWDKLAADDGKAVRADWLVWVWARHCTAAFSRPDTAGTVRMPLRAFSRHMLDYPGLSSGLGHEDFYRLIYQLVGPNARAIPLAADMQHIDSTIEEWTQRPAKGNVWYFFERFLEECAKTLYFTHRVSPYLMTLWASRATETMYTPVMWEHAAKFISAQPSPFTRDPVETLKGEYRGEKLEN